MDQTADLAAPPPERRAAEVMSPTLPLPPPKDIESLTLFIDWIASTPTEKLAAVTSYIRELSERSQIAELLGQQIHTLPCQDLGRHLLLLSIAGELSEESSIEVLEQFVWLSDEQIWGEAIRREFMDCDFGPSGMLQARAAEMLVWVTKDAAADRVQRILQEHSSATVRIALIDAYLFSQHDSEDARNFLVERVRSDDMWAVGLPRRVDGMDPEEFDRRVDELEAAWADKPELPTKSGRH